MNYLLAMERTGFKVLNHAISAWLLEVAVQQRAPISHPWPGAAGADGAGKPREPVLNGEAYVYA